MSPHRVHSSRQGRPKVQEHIVNQPLTEISIFECVACQKGPVRSDRNHQPYPCPFCGRLMPVVRTEWEERGSQTAPKRREEQAYAGDASRFRA